MYNVMVRTFVVTDYLEPHTKNSQTKFQKSISPLKLIIMFVRAHFGNTIWMTCLQVILNDCLRLYWQYSILYGFPIKFRFVDSIKKSIGTYLRKRYVCLYIFYTALYNIHYIYKKMPVKTYIYNKQRTLFHASKTFR